MEVWSLVGADEQLVRLLDDIKKKKIFGEVDKVAPFRIALESEDMIPGVRHASTLISRITGLVIRPFDLQANIIGWFRVNERRT